METSGGNRRRSPDFFLLALFFFLLHLLLGPNTFYSRIISSQGPNAKDTVMPHPRLYARSCILTASHTHTHTRTHTHTHTDTHTLPFSSANQHSACDSQMPATLDVIRTPTYFPAGSRDLSWLPMKSQPRLVVQLKTGQCPAGVRPERPP